MTAAGSFAAEDSRTERAMNSGDRVELVAVSDDYRTFALSRGERGTVEFTDSLGTVHIRWDNGARVGIIAEAVGLIRPTGESS